MRPLFHLSLPALLLLLPCCAGSKTLEPTFEGCATDENWRTFDDYETTARVNSDPASNPVWTMPTAGATLSAGSPPTFQWRVSMALAGNPEGNVQCGQAAAAMLRTASIRPQHLPPISGNVFDLHFQSGGADVYRLMTSKEHGTVPASTWAGWAGQGITINLIEGGLLQNEIVQGPYQAAPLTIQVSP